MTTDVGVLLAEVEKRWPQSRYDLRIERELDQMAIEQPWCIEVSPVEKIKGHAVGEGRTLIAALEDLLGKDDELAEARVEVERLRDRAALHALLKKLEKDNQ